MRFDQYVTHISKYGKVPQGVSRPRAIRVEAAEGHVPVTGARELTVPTREAVARRLERINGSRGTAA